MAFLLVLLSATAVVVLLALVRLCRERRRNPLTLLCRAYEQRRQQRLQRQALEHFRLPQECQLAPPPAPPDPRLPSFPPFYLSAGDLYIDEPLLII
jgi:hypothetical protein